MVVINQSIDLPCMYCQKGKTFPDEDGSFEIHRPWQGMSRSLQDLAAASLAAVRPESGQQAHVTTSQGMADAQAFEDEFPGQTRRTETGHGLRPGDQAGPLLSNDDSGDLANGKDELEYSQAPELGPHIENSVRNSETAKARETVRYFQRQLARLLEDRPSQSQAQGRSSAMTAATAGKLPEENDTRAQASQTGNNAAGEPAGESEDLQTSTRETPEVRRSTRPRKETEKARKSRDGQ